MPEHLADEIEAVAARHGDRGEAVPKVMNADIIEPSRPTDVLPGLLNADEMSVAALGGQNVWVARLSRQFGTRETLAAWRGPGGVPRRQQRSSLGRSSGSVTPSQPAEILVIRMFSERLPSPSWFSRL